LLRRIRKYLTGMPAEHNEKTVSSSEEKLTQEPVLVQSITWVPPGHYYSPIVDPGEVSLRLSRIFDRTDRSLPDVDVNVAGQLENLSKYSTFKDQIKFDLNKTDLRRYHLNNPAFNSVDAWALAATILHYQPKRIIEIGSGYSSALTMDTNTEAFGGNISITFVEPYPQLLRSLMKPEDLERYKIYESKVQDVDINLYSMLEENDILFIDSTHVAKAGSDVLHEFFEILPRLKRGVIVHIHDIYFPFEYPESWFFDENRSWNEAYLLRAFLMNSNRYKIILWPHYLVLHHRQALINAMPLGTHLWGGSIWLSSRGSR
jgi:Methyltransferase domain